MRLIRNLKAPSRDSYTRNSQAAGDNRPGHTIPIGYAMPALTDKQKRFVAEYLVDLNATQAAIRAGYSAKTAEQQASRLLRNVQVRAAVEQGQQKTAAKLEVTKERIVEELAKIGFSNMLDYMRAGHDGDPYLDFSELTRDQAAALSEVTVEDFRDGRGEDARDVRRVKFKLHDKKGALVDLAKMLGFMVEKHEVTGKDGGPIQTETRTWREVLRQEKKG